MAKAKQKPEMRAFLACEGVTRDPVEQKPALYGVFDLIYTEGFPSIFRPFFLFIRMTGPKGKRKVSLKGYDPDGNEIGKVDPVAAAFSGTGSADIVIRLGGFPLLSPGKIVFKLFIDGKQVGWPCEITVQKRPAKPKKP